MNARPTIYRGVGMRSRLEAGFATWLDQNRIPWDYEPHAFGDEHGQYLPDFRINVPVSQLNGRPPVYVECKPTRSEARMAAGRMSIIWASEEDAILIVAYPEADVFGMGMAGRWFTGAFVHGHNGVEVAFLAKRPWHGKWWDVA